MQEASGDSAQMGVTECARQATYNLGPCVEHEGCRKGGRKDRAQTGSEGVAHEDED